MNSQSVSKFWAIVAFMLMIQFGTVQAFVTISTEEKNYLLYEPIYIEISFDPEGLDDDFFISNLRDAKAMISLMIIDPKGDQTEYRPLVKEFSFKGDEEEYLHHETVVLNRNKLVLSDIGRYSFYIIDKRNGSRISNEIGLDVNETYDEVELSIQKDIQISPIDYGFFVYLDGGDQFRNGKEIIEKIANSNSKMKGIAKSILAINYSQIKYNYKEGVVERQRDIEKFELNFPEERAEGQFVPKYLKLQATKMFFEQFSETDLSPNLKQKIFKVWEDQKDVLKSMKRYKKVALIMKHIKKN